MKTVLSLLLTAFLACAAPTAYSANDEMRFSDGYEGSSYTGTSTETVSYATKSETESYISGDLPKYYNKGTNTNACATVAGAIIVGYYDKTYTNLIENFTSARTVKNLTVYNAQTSTVQTVIDTLYTLMGTNSGSSGTTVSGFKSGLKSYVVGQGYSISYSSVGSYSSFSSTKYTTAINNKLPVALFVSGYSIITSSSSSSSTDTYEIKNYSGNHVLVGCGIKTVSYYNASGSLTKQYTLLKVATGFNETISYILLKNFNSIIDSYSVTVS